MAERQEYTRKLDEVYHASMVHTKRLMKMFAEPAAFAAGDEEGESGQAEVMKFFAETILSGVSGALCNYFEDNEIYEMLNNAEFYRESKEIKKPSLREAQKRVALISGQKLTEGVFSEIDLDNKEDAIENFCILMDWDVEPENVVSCEALDGGKYEMELDDGTSFVYDKENDCIC